MTLISPNGVEVDAEAAHAKRLLAQGFVLPAARARGAKDKGAKDTGDEAKGAAPAQGK